MDCIVHEVTKSRTGLSDLHFHFSLSFKVQVSLVAQMVKESVCNAGDPGLIPGSGRCPGERNGNPLQYSCLENPWTE